MALPLRNPTQVQAQMQSPPSAAPQSRRLKKGDLLFAEGENSRAMYYIRSGMIRLFKKKGDSDIELDTVRAGQILGELAFLDGNPRSASGEALTDCELTEISGSAFQDVLAKMPEWLKMLLKTVVGRLRTASTRIRQLESASTAFDYSEKDGKRSSHYVYLSPTDVLKMATAILLVGSRNGTAENGVIALRLGLINRYANQIMGVPSAKIQSFLDLLSQSGVVAQKTDEGEDGKVYLKDIAFLEQMIAYLNEENLLEPSKRHDISPRSFLIMSCINKHLGEFPADPAGVSKINLATIKKAETPEGGKEPFRMDEFAELMKLGYVSNLNIKSNEEVFTMIQSAKFSQVYRLQRITVSIQMLNEQKRKGAKS